MLSLIFKKFFSLGNKHTQATLTLCRFLPPTAKGKNKAAREKSTAVLQKIILFKKVYYRIYLIILAMSKASLYIYVILFILFFVLF